MNYKSLLLVSLVSLTLSSCLKKESVVCPPTEGQVGQRMLILNEGLFQQNNASLTWANFSSGAVSQNYFQQIAGRPLGDTGNDIKKYGNKIYIVLNISSTIEVLDATTYAVIEQIEMHNNGLAKQPRYIDFHGGKAFVTCYDGYVDVIDTLNLSVIHRIPVGSNPDHLRVAGNMVYVSNSGGLNFPDYDSTVSVISALSLTEIKKINVGINPGSIAVGGNGNVYVVTRGNFGSIPSRMSKIETLTDTKSESYAFEVNSLSEKNGDVLIFETIGAPSIKLFDVNSNVLQNASLIDFTGIVTPYEVQYESSIDRIYVFDANSYVNIGKVLEYSGNGGFIRAYQAGLVTKRLVFL